MLFAAYVVLKCKYKKNKDTSTSQWLLNTSHTSPQPHSHAGMTVRSATATANDVWKN